MKNENEKTMINRLSGKFIATIEVLHIKMDTFVAIYEEKDTYSNAKMVFAITVYNFYKREDLLYP